MLKKIIATAIIVTSMNSQSAEVYSINCNTINECSYVDVEISWNDNDYGKSFFVWAKDNKGNNFTFEEILKFTQQNSSVMRFNFKKLKGPITGFSVTSNNIYGSSIYDNWKNHNPAPNKFVNVFRYNCS